MGLSVGIILGVTFCLLAASLSSLGLVLMKEVIQFEDPEILVGASLPHEDDSPRSPRRASVSFYEDALVARQASRIIMHKANLRWFGGLSLFIVGQILNLLSLSFLSEIVWAVLSLFSLVTNAFFARLILKERFTPFDLIYVAVIILGSSLVLVANRDSVGAEAAGLSIASLKAHFHRPWFVLYASLLGSILFSSILFGMRTLGRGQRVSALTWTIFSSACGSVSVMLGKCIVEVVGILATGTTESDLFSAPSTYVVLIIWMLSAAGALVSLNMALAVGEAMVVIPWLTVANTLLAILGGIFFFEEFSTFQTVSKLVVFLVGVILAILGAYFLQTGRAKCKTAAPNGFQPLSEKDYNTFDAVETKSS